MASNRFRSARRGLVLVGLLLAHCAQAAAGAAPRQEVASSSALLVDLSTDEVLYSSHADRVVPIASVTKLMTALVVLDARQPLDEYITVSIDDVAEMRGVYSRVRLGSEATRRDLLLITLMSSENRAAASLAQHYPGGGRAFVAAMNAKAQEIGMRNTRFAEPTGLSRHNVSSAEDLVKLIRAVQGYPVIGWFSSAVEESVTFRKPVYTLEFRNTNGLVRKADWSIQVTKTGYTAAAGRCLVMQTQIADRPVALVVLDAYGKFTHVADASRLKTWLETGRITPVAPAALAYKRERLAQRSTL